MQKHLIITRDAEYILEKRIRGTFIQMVKPEIWDKEKEVYAITQDKRAYELTQESFEMHKKKGFTDFSMISKRGSVIIYADGWTKPIVDIRNVETQAA